MSKDEASDLKSHIDRLVQTELEFLRAQIVRDEARRLLQIFTYDLQLMS